MCFLWYFHPKSAEIPVRRKVGSHPDLGADLSDAVAGGPGNWAIEDSDEARDVAYVASTVELRKVTKVVKCLAMLRARIFLTISLDFAKGWHFDRLQSGASILTQDQISGTAVPFWAPAGSGAIGAARLPMGQCL